jgi:hypothetical protein
MSTRRAASILEFGVDDAWNCHDDLEYGDRSFDLRERFLITHCCWESQLVHGHVLMSDRMQKHCKERYKFLTIMRDPVERAISNYRMAVNAGIASSDPDIWLGSPIARAHTTTYLRYLSGNHLVAADQEAACLERALSTLKLFTLIGFLDDIASFARDFERIFGAHLNLREYNKAKGAEVVLNDTQMAKLREMCVSDQKIYDQALHLKDRSSATER